MSIESNGTAGAPTAAAQGVAGHRHGKATGNPAEGGFAALLTNLGADEVPLEGGLMAKDDKNTELSDATVSASIPEDASHANAAPIWAPPATAESTRVLPAAVDTLPQALAGLAAAGPVAGETVEGAALVRTDPAPIRPALPAPMVSLASVIPDGNVAPELPDQPADMSAADVQQLLKQAVVAQRASRHGLQAAEAASQAVKEHHESVVARLGWQVGETLNPVTSQAQLSQMSGGSDVGARPWDRRAEKAGHRDAAMGEHGIFRGLVASEGMRWDVPAAAPDAGLMTQTRVAEQVSYWVSHGVQNAELELDGLGEGPVKVNIALQGKEASVEFRSDQAQTRQVLHDSMPQLRDLLAREGLVLSGVSVGGSGAEAAGGRQPQARPASRQGVVAAPDMTVEAVRARPGTLTGRSVDLFV